MEQQIRFQNKMKEYISSEQFRYVYLNGEITHFMISSTGRLFSLDYGRSSEIHIILPTLNKDGHMAVTLKHNGNNYYKSIHRLVAEAFLPNPDNKS